MAEYVSPVSGTWAGRGGSKFKARRGFKGRLHAGNDLQARNGSKAVAVIGGRVLYAGRNDGYGANAVVLGEDGNAYRYATHGSVNVKVGDYVPQGAPVGTIAAGHLHFEVIPSGSPALAKMVANPGQFVGTQYWTGGQPVTVDPASFFGVQSGTQLVAGRPVGDPNAATLVAETGRHPFLGAASAPPVPRLNPLRTFDRLSVPTANPMASALAAKTPDTIAPKVNLFNSQPTIPSTNPRPVVAPPTTASSLSGAPGAVSDPFRSPRAMYGDIIRQIDTHPVVQASRQSATIPGGRLSPEYVRPANLGVRSRMPANVSQQMAETNAARAENVRRNAVQNLRGGLLAGSLSDAQERAKLNDRPTSAPFTRSTLVSRPLGGETGRGEGSIAPTRAMASRAVAEAPKVSLKSPSAQFSASDMARGKTPTPTPVKGTLQGYRTTNPATVAPPAQSPPPVQAEEIYQGRYRPPLMSSIATPAPVPTGPVATVPIPGTPLAVTGPVALAPLSARNVSSRGVASGGFTATGPAGGFQVSELDRVSPGSKATYGRKQSDGSVKGTTSSGAGYSVSKDGTITTKSGSYKENKSGRGYSKSKIICSYFYRIGRLPRDIWRADQRWGATRPAILHLGYHAWADHVVRAMERGGTTGRALEYVLFPLASAWAHEAAYKIGYLPKGTIRGKLARLILEPPSYLIGLIVTSRLNRVWQW